MQIMVWNTLKVLLFTALVGIAIHSVSSETMPKRMPDEFADGLTLIKLNKTDEFRHRGNNLSTMLDLADSLKYEVEIIEPNDNNNNNMEEENLHIEERFKGPSLHFVSDQFYAENIEVNENTIQRNHLIMTILLVAMTLASVGIYVALVVWRSQLEQRYGMRERLVTEDGFCYSANDRHLTVSSA